MTRHRRARRPRPRARPSAPATTRVSSRRGSAAHTRRRTPRARSHADAHDMTCGSGAGHCVERRDDVVFVTDEARLRRRASWNRAAEEHASHVLRTYRVSNLHPWWSARRVAVRNRRTDMSDSWRHRHDSAEATAGPAAATVVVRRREHAFPAAVDRLRAFVRFGRWCETCWPEESLARRPLVDVPLTASFHACTLAHHQDDRRDGYDNRRAPRAESERPPGRPPIEGTIGRTTTAGTAARTIAPPARAGREIAGTGRGGHPGRGFDPNAGNPAVMNRPSLMHGRGGYPRAGIGRVGCTARARSTTKTDPLFIRATATATEATTRAKSESARRASTSRWIGLTHPPGTTAARRLLPGSGTACTRARSGRRIGELPLGGGRARARTCLGATPTGCRVRRPRRFAGYSEERLRGPHARDGAVRGNGTVARAAGAHWPASLGAGVGGPTASP